ncbi:ATPase family AAA domain-containing protein 2B isoform X1 [Lates japonicus]|uniref:ATPase family AAA domain-containing protein 2B isoform X1 n=1 Tax=Lates japonicus TaxID=270547 RepID=A0AAD3NJ22_LATJO|nr:ATPase family AAA domain-containing protein 2B isoform X1 [Lates japonicus]
MVVKKSEGYSVEQLERLYSLLSQCIYQYRREYDKTQLLENPIWSSAAAVGCQCRQRARSGSALVLVARAGCQDVRERKRQREERAVSQVVPPVDRPAGGGGEGACLGSSHTASLNWCFQSRNVSSFGTCFVCLCFQHTS